MAGPSPTSEFIWNVDMEVNLFHAMRGHKPAGVNRHFQMIAIHEKLSSASKKISSGDVWHHLSTLYDLQALNESEIVPFPNKSSDFSLPSSSTSSLGEQTFPRSPFINSSGKEEHKSEASSKTPVPKSSSSSSSKSESSIHKSSSSSTPASSHKSDASKHDSKHDSKSSHSKSSSQKSSSGSSSSSSTPKLGSSSTPKLGSSAHSQALFTPDPSPKRTKRTRGPSAGASPATPTEPAAKRRR